MTLKEVLMLCNLAKPLAPQAMLTTVDLLQQYIVQ